MGGVIQPKSEGLRIMGAYGVSLCLRAGEDRCSSSGSQTEKVKFSIPVPFCSIQALKGLEDAHPYWGGQSASLYLFKC